MEQMLCSGIQHNIDMFCTVPTTCLYRGSVDRNPGRNAHVRP